MKKVLSFVALSMLLFSCGKKNCYDCSTTWSEKVYNQQNTILYQKSMKTEEFCGTEEEMMAHEDENTFSYVNSEGKNTVQGTNCILVK